MYNTAQLIEINDTIIIQNYRKTLSTDLFTKDVYDELLSISKRIQTTNLDSIKYKLLAGFITDYDCFGNPISTSSVSPLYFIYKDFYKIPVDSNEIKRMRSDSFQKTKNNQVEFLTYHIGSPNDNDLFHRPSPKNLGLDNLDEYNIDKNGTYIINYFPKYNDSTSSWEDRPFAIFNIQNSILEGNAIWFTPNGDTLAYGSYTKNKKEDLWIFYEAYYENSKPIKRLKFQTTFKEGVPKGQFKVYLDENLFLETVINKGRPSEYYRQYNENGQIKYDFLLKDTVTGFTPCYNWIDYDAFRINQKGIMNFYIPFWIKFEDRYGEKELLFIEDEYFPILQYMEGKNSSFYDNGKIKTSFTFENGEIVSGNKSYYSNGKVLREWDMTTRTITQYNENGEEHTVNKYDNECD
ncbi:hypothetical protein SAMN05216474_1772 [Lishizhenia tianjinensis]|uniref:Antitoxin component YwqK of the YwqJK toxin-antitoxin module n=1 Tax=Lishizhenia tianjinensis TaxID=477690 RepID=A0A1I6ZZY3_9FLAO|nr:hypothetical protein [Lishizhenia tianjinensis]SFT68230.1 hypothetical protein SAMN05216474_1772 [Lishizhenia tianjinensis]